MATGTTSAMSTEMGSAITEGSMNCLALHKDGLYAAGEDGVLRHLEVSPTDRVRILASYPISSPVSSLSFSSSFQNLALGVTKVSLQTVISP